MAAGLRAVKRSGRLALALFAVVAAAALGAAPARAGVVLVTGLTDAGFSQVSPMATQSAVIRNCVNSSSGKYRVTATGSGSGGGFALTAGAGLSLPYSVEWSDSSTATTGQSLTAGVALGGQVTPFLTTCILGSVTSTLIVRLAASDLQTAVAGVTYTGVVTLLVAPE